MNAKELYEYRKAAGICTVCGKARDNDRWVTCTICHENLRNYHAEHYAVKKAKEFEESRKQKPGLMLNPEICLNCCWSKYDGSALHCLFTSGTCMRKDPFFRNMFLSRRKKK